MSEKRKRCFVIMPFSDSASHTEKYWTSHFENFLKPLIEDSGRCEAFRSEASRGSLSQEIIMNLMESDIVVADLTDYNPNVYLELGIRISFKDGTILIAEIGTDIPFHLKNRGILFYDKWHLDKEFNEKMKNELEDCCQHPEKTDSPILEAIHGRGTLYNLIHKDENQRRLNALISELDNLKLDFNAIIEQLEGTSSPMRTLIPNSLELLLTQRYLDLSDDTYDILQRYYRMFNTINNNLRNVVQNREGVKKNLLSSKDEFLRLNEDLEKLLILFLKQLESY